MPEPELGDRQGGPREIVHGANTWRLTLCSTCVEPLFDLYEECVDEVIIRGTAPGLDKVLYLPRVSKPEHDDGPVATGPSAATPEPPEFSM